MAGRLSRFLNLEGARPKSGATQPPISGRFSGPSPDDELQAKRRAQFESGLALDEHPDGEQPFVRCGQCETDSARETALCKTCGAALDTPAQRAFNVALWQQQRAETMRESEESAARARVETRSRETSEQEPERLNWLQRLRLSWEKITSWK